MKNWYLKSAFMLATVICAGMSHLEACTGIKLVAKDGSIVSGRTLEFGVMVDTSAVVVPRGYKFVGSTPNGNGLSYTSKYAVLGAMAFNNPAIMDGINEKGLMIGMFYFPGFAEYMPLTAENQAKALSPIDFSNWIITQFATVDEVKAALPSVAVVPTVMKGWGSTPAPFHYFVMDKSGKSLVIEPIGGKLVTYDNPIGVLTNSPSFDWHMTNLRNFINLSPDNSKPITMDKVVFAPFGQGSGMVGLPGDFTPPSRFVRAAIFSATAIPSANSEEAVYQAFHILNQFDIPVGIARQVSDGVTHTDYTLLTAVRDPQTLKYYFKSYDDQNIQVIDLKQFNLDAKNIVSITTAGSSRAKDISKELK